MAEALQLLRVLSLTAVSRLLSS